MIVPQNDIFLRALRQEHVDRPPVWMMRQAGRYLPDYMRLRDKYDFFTRVQTPELAAEITLQPIDQIGVDAAILFSDILVVPQAMGLEVLMEEGKGPVLPRVVSSEKDIEALETGEIDRLNYVFEAIKLTKSRLDNRVPLIGFAGAPWTLFCYMVEGRGSKSWDRAKQFLCVKPELAHRLLQKITDLTVCYLQKQADAGADALLVFDSWAGSLSPDDFQIFALPYLTQIIEALKGRVPVILFPKGAWYALKSLSEYGPSAIGIDWCVSAQYARSVIGNQITIQGNFDPAWLLATPEEIGRRVKRMIDEFGVQNYVANLGHGITPHVPVAHARAFVDAVKNYKKV